MAYQLVANDTAAPASDASSVCDGASATNCDRRSALALVEQSFAERRRCPRCDVADIERWGVRAGLQRWRCRACNRTFNALTGTPLARLRHRDRWLDHGVVLQAGLSLRAAGRRLGLHYNTMFRWRHRWLERPRALRDGLQGVIALDVVAFRDCPGSRRRWRRVAIGPDPTDGPASTLSGSRPAPLSVLLAQDRFDALTDRILSELNPPSIELALGGLLEESRVTRCADHAILSFCSNHAGLVQAGQSRADLQHLPIMSAARGDGRTTPCAGAGERQCRDIRAYAVRLERWMGRFRGIGARYLANSMAGGGCSNVA